MKALRSFAVRASLPERLGVLSRLAMNLRWTWNDECVELFRWIDPQSWEESGHDPVQMLGMVSKKRLRQLSEDGPFMGFLANVEEDLQRYMEEPRWYQSREKRGRDRIRTVAYFSPEFGVGEALPIYSGGLGILAGDHLKAASDLGVPLVGVGLFYRQGYFRQHLSADGWQQENYPSLDPHAMPVQLLFGDDGLPLKIQVELEGATCYAQLWCAQVGRVPLLLMDCDVEENDSAERAITDRLYAGGSEHRLRQEIVLGVGGIRALEATGYDADVFHSNEGHAGFLGLERIRRLVAENGLTFAEALEAVRASTVFTTHTPVPAGIDVYTADLMQRYFHSFASELGCTWNDFLALGQNVHEAESSPTFNMAMMGFNLAGRSNGVSKLHGHVSRSMFSGLWPELPVDEVPVGSITNGVHTATWLGPEMAEVFERRHTPGWAERGDARWDRIGDVPDAELWRARERARERLVYFARERVRKQLLARGMSQSEAAWADDVFDPGILTIGFARRFALYKRGTLMLSDPDRLKALLTSGDRPIQIVLAGKSHPLDEGGKEMIRRIVHFSQDPEVRHRIAFIEDYDMEVGRALVQGCDVWLNNPRRPLEASGTSGMKAALNGSLNCSILDGWWDECYNGENGWAIGSITTYNDDEYQDRVEASALYDLLERDIVPRFYDRSEGPVPRRWVERIKASIVSLGGFITADRMVRDYVKALYEPASKQAREVFAGDFARAKALAAWKQRVKDAWDDVKILDVEGDVRASDVGEEREVTARIRIGRLTNDDVSVQLAHGRVGAEGELLEPAVVKMAPASAEDGVSTFSGRFSAESPGLYGFAVRVVPSHPDLTHSMEMGLIAWA
jgi:glycogen phosphorylase